MAEYKVDYRELDEVWPWNRVMRWHERITVRNFTRALPLYEQMALTVNMHRRKGAQAVTAVRLMPPFLVPPDLQNDRAGVAKYSEAVVEAFEHALEHGHVSNGLLAYLDTRHLRASGAVV